jgi:hypothetical protein
MAKAVIMEVAAPSGPCPLTLLLLYKQGLYY